MPVAETSLVTDNAALYYYKAGSGKKLLLAFHGFGQDHSVFKPLVAALGQHYTFYLFDLFFHGKSTWPDEEMPLKKDQWKSMLQQFITKEQIEQFSVAGFSIGAKFALATLEAFPEKVEKVFLIAPDGIKTSIWYTLATSSPLRGLFKSMIRHGNRFMSLLGLVRRLHLADKRLLLFASHQMNTEEKRRRVYGSWMVFRLLKFNIQSLARLIDTFSIQVLVITGRQDLLIKPGWIKPLLKRSKNSRLQVLEAGHNRLLTHEQLPRLIQDTK